MKATKTAVSFSLMAKELFSFMNNIKAIFVHECCHSKHFLAEIIDLKIGT